MKNFSKSKNGISPILATLLLITIALAAVIVTYAWVMTFTASTTDSQGPLLKQENVSFYTSETASYVEVIVRNSGTKDTQVDMVYAGTTTSNLSVQSHVTYNPISQIVQAGSTLQVNIEYDWEDGITYYFKITTEEGLEIQFSKEA
jgi:flagellin-like protein